MIRFQHPQVAFLSPLLSYVSCDVESLSQLICNRSCDRSTSGLNEFQSVTILKLVLYFSHTNLKQISSVTIISVNHTVNLSHLVQQTVICLGLEIPASIPADLNMIIGPEVQTCVGCLESISLLSTLYTPLV